MKRWSRVGQHTGLEGVPGCWTSFNLNLAISITSKVRIPPICNGMQLPGSGNGYLDLCDRWQVAGEGQDEGQDTGFG